MVVYPLTTAEDRAIRWATRAVSAMATLVIVLLGAISIASLPA